MRKLQAKNSNKKEYYEEHITVSTWEEKRIVYLRCVVLLGFTPLGRENICLPSHP